MKIAIFGAGAIGGYLAVKLHQSGADVRVITRGAHLAAIRENGLTLKGDGQTINARLPAFSRAEEAGEQDTVIVTLKANALLSAAPQIARLMGPQTVLVIASNGVPYWYFYGFASPWHGHVLESVDPGGRLWHLLSPAHVVGCVVYHAAEVIAPGVIEYTYCNRFSLGEPDDTRSARVEALSVLLSRAGLKAPICDDIRSELWTKLWGNLAFNPMSALTGSTVDKLAFDPGLRALARAMMQEAAAVAEALGARFPMTIDQRIDLTGGVGAHKTSMLQDLERGRPMEIEPLLGAVVELGRLTGKAMPMCEAILTLVRARAQQLGLSPQDAIVTAAPRKAHGL